MFPKMIGLNLIFVFIDEHVLHVPHISGDLTYKASAIVI